MKKTAGQLSVLVSSTVYGVEELLERIYVLLTQYGYDVWMSHKGTMPVLPDRSNSENCLAAVEACDLFLGIITTQYGSGKMRAPGHHDHADHSIVITRIGDHDQPDR